MADAPYSREEFEVKLRGKGIYYHIHHPFHLMMNSGKCTQKQIQGWVANRFYYQTAIPVKDANVLANCADREVRKKWVQRVLDHDGYGGEEGGIEAWLRLGESVGLKREEVTSLELVLPGVRYAVDAYVNFARNVSWQEAACSSLTEMFAPDIHKKRLDSWPIHYPWIDKGGYDYFRNRLAEARRDVEHGLALTLDHFNTAELQHRALDVLQFKLDLLWTMLDAMTLAYVHKQPPYYNIGKGTSTSIDTNHGMGSDSSIHGAFDA